MTTMKQQKARLRQEMLARRDSLSAEQVAARSEQITQRVLALPAVAAARHLLLFASFGSEVATRPLLDWALRLERNVILPRVNRQTHRLDLYRIQDPEQDLQPGLWGILEPVPERCSEIAPADLDLVIVPGVAFDQRGNRLGYGGGFYDHLLTEIRSDLWPRHVLAPAFELQLVATVPAKSKDIPVPIIATEERLIITK